MIVNYVFKRSFWQPYNLYTLSWYNNVTLYLLECKMRCVMFKSNRCRENALVTLIGWFLMYQLNVGTRQNHISSIISVLLKNLVQ